MYLGACGGPCKLGLQLTASSLTGCSLEMGTDEEPPPQPLLKSFFLRAIMGLESQLLNDYEYWLLFHRFMLKSHHLHGSLQPSVTPVPADMASMDTRRTDIHANKTPIHIAYI